MEEYEGLKIPDGENAEKVFNEGYVAGKYGACDGYGPTTKLGCFGGRISCGECLFSNPHKLIFKKYLKTKGKHTPLNKCFNKENNMNISDNILTVFEDSATTAGKVAKRFGSEYGDTTRDRLALERDKVDLLTIIAVEEKDAAKDK